VASFGVLAVNALFLGLFVTRPKPKSETSSLPIWLLATTGLALPLLLRPGGTVQYLSLGYALQVVGLAMIGAAILSLRRSFAVVPGNRGIRSGGLYRVVRHPMYLSELTTLLGVVLANLTAANLLIWVCTCGVQYVRARAEEDFLSPDPEYRAYRERVRYRFIPGVL
jgi:protein-S-isoprenylcysteine O-methyltransferase Ste14